MRNHDESECDVVILGAGYVGLALGLSLAIALGGEARIVLVDKQGLARSGGDDLRAYALSAGSKRLLDAVGAWAHMERHAQAVQAIDITDSALQHAIRPVLLSWDNMVGSTEPASWIVEGAKLKSALVAVAEATPGLEILAPGEAVGTHATEAGVEIHLAGRGRLRARLAVAAEGRRSPMRDAAGIKLVRWEQPQQAIVTTVALERPHGGRATQHFLPGGPFAILPLTGDRACVTWTEDKESARRILALDNDGFRAQVQERFGYRLGNLALAGPRAAWPIAFHMARSLIAPRLALAGDSARSVHPIAGQGLNLGFKDVAALAECIADSMRLGLDPGSPIVLDRYERWRRFDSVQAAALFEVLNGLFSNDVGVVRTLRDVGLGLVNRSPALKNALVAEAAGLTGEVPRLLMGGMA